MTLMNRNHVSRRARERKQLRLRILDAARTLFARGGEDAVTLRRVAELIEFSATTIYSCFPHKEALVQEICEIEFSIFGQLLQRAGQCPDAMDGLKNVAMAYIDFGLQRPEHYRVLFMREPANRAESRHAETSKTAEPTRVASTRYPEVEPVPTTRGAGPYEYLQQAIFKAMAASCFKPEYRDVNLLAQTVWSCLHGVVALHLVRSQHPGVAWKPVQHLAEMSVEGLFNGLTVSSCQIPPTWRR